MHNWKTCEFGSGGYGGIYEYIYSTWDCGTRFVLFWNVSLQVHYVWRRVSEICYYVNQWVRWKCFFLFCVQWRLITCWCLIILIKINAFSYYLLWIFLKKVDERAMDWCLVANFMSQNWVEEAPILWFRNFVESLDARISWLKKIFEKSTVNSKVRLARRE